MTAGVRKTVEEMTSHPVDTCPWHAMTQPFVHRVLAALPFFESGQLAFRAPNPSHRLVTGISFYTGVSDRIHAKQLRLDEEQRKREQQQKPTGKGRR